MATLTSQQLKDSYQSLVTIGDSITSNPTSGQLENGLGNPISALGIGTDSPTDALNISSASNQIGLDTGNQATYGTLDVGHFTNGAFIGTQAGSNTVSDLLRLGTSGTERMKVHSSGDISFRDTSSNEAFYWDASTARLGIGTVPSTPLHVNATNANACIINVTGTSPNYIFDIRDDNVSQFRVDSSGQVGIGTSSPQDFASNRKTLEVASSQGAYIVASDTTNSAYAQIASEASAGYIGMRTNHPVNFITNNTPRITLDTSGNVGIGVSPSSGRLDIKGENTSNGTNALFVQNSNSAYLLAVRNDGETVISGNVGIGETNPSSKLSIKGADAAIDITRGTSGDSKWGFSSDSTSLYIAELSTGVPDYVMTFQETTGNVGIGETNPDSTLHLKSASAELLELERTSIGAYRLAISGSDAFSIYDVGEDSDRLVIDSSGHLMVGTDNLTWQSEAGLRYFNGSSLNVTRDGNEPLNLNRLTSDGDIVIFRRDGNEIGAIGSISSDLYIAESSVGLRFDGENNQILPSSTTASTDNTCNLGASSSRFKDLYLGGNVILSSGQGIDFSDTANSSGTMTSELLDDYEEGTWTPTITAGYTSPTYTDTAGYYTKIGNVVNITLRLQLTGGTADGNQITISGLPFTSKNNSGSQSSLNIGFFNSTGYDGTQLLFIASNVTSIVIYDADGTTLTGTEMGDNTWILHASGFYLT